MTPSFREFFKYSLRTKPKSCIDFVISCAKDGQEHWQNLFKDGLLDVISEDPALQRYFFLHLCINSVQPQSNAIFKAYLEGLTPEFHAKFFSKPALKDKNHPANHIFSKAALERRTGGLSLQLLDTLIKTGLRGELMLQLAIQRHSYVGQACKGENQPFLDFLFSNLKPAPEKLLIHVVKSVHGNKIAAALICSTPTLLPEFLKDEVLSHAHENARTFLVGKEARTNREPERPRQTLGKSA